MKVILQKEVSPPTPSHTFLNIEANVLYQKHIFFKRYNHFFKPLNPKAFLCISINNPTFICLKGMFLEGSESFLSSTPLIEPDLYNM